MGRYSNLWIRQAYFAGGFYNGANSPTFGLYNNSPTQYLVVRALELAIYNNQAVVEVGPVKGQVSGSNLTVTSLSFDTGLPTGLLTSSGQTSSPLGSAFWAVDIGSSTWSWIHDFPVAVIQPGWSLVAYNSTNAANMGSGWWWEAVEIDQLEPWVERAREFAG